jgi:hypothetical protein
MDQVSRREMETHIMVHSKTRTEIKMVVEASALVMELVIVVTDQRMEQVTDRATAQEPATVMVLVLKETVAAEAESKY